MKDTDIKRDKPYETTQTERPLNDADIEAFRKKLYESEKSSKTIEKYLRDAKHFRQFLNGRAPTKELVLAYKSTLGDSGYSINTVNSMLASLNSLLVSIGRRDITAKRLRTQHKAYLSESKILSRSEYERMLEAASKRTDSLYLIMQTICATGIRVSELCHFTVDAVKCGEVTVSCKGKIRTILLPSKLKKLLLDHCEKQHINEGAIFVGNDGRPISRTSIWGKMKRLAKIAGVDADKVFPHNLRKLFARTFYESSKDISKLADILGHQSIETTRIYIMTTGKEHRRRIESLGLVIDIKKAAT